MLATGTALGSALGGALALGTAAPAHPSPTDGTDTADTEVTAYADSWRTVLDDADLVWRRLPTAWFEGPFLGNGFLGTGVYAEPGGTAVRFTVQHSEVQDHRPEFGSLFGLARLPVGHFTLEPVGTVTAVDWRLRLRGAELTGTLTTTAGTLRLRAFVHSTTPVLTVELTPDDGERAARWVFHPAVAVSPRAAFRPLPEGYRANPPAVVERHGEVTAAVQPLLAGGEHVTAWRERTTRRPGPDGHIRTRTLQVTVAHSFPRTTARQRALRTVRRASAVPYDVLMAPHRAWWDRYYRRSFLSLPDARLQRFHWIQLYKAASAARRDAPVMATCGPWLEPTPWPATWWNLNVQLAYWLIHGSNHLELDAVTRALGEFRDQLTAEVAPAYRADSAGIPRTTDTRLVNGGATPSGQGYGVGIPGQNPPTPEVGNLTWALHNVWLSYRHTMDASILRDTLFPLLRRAVSYYLHFLAPGPDGKLHLPRTFSPEYGVDAPDCNYDLMLLRWGCRTLLESAAELGVVDPLADRWREVLARLTPYPVDAGGFMIGAGVPFARSHRHYSHLLAVYPLYEITGRTPDERALIERSLRHWVAFEGALQGYTFTGAASISALLGKGEDALRHLERLLSRFIRPNTLYQESGPVIETPLSASQSLHDMVCQSWGGVVRVFPALPAAWREVTVHDFRTQGAFLLSAVREEGRTRWVRLRSEAGAPCVVRHGIEGPVEVRDRRGRPLRHEDAGTGDGAIRLRLGRGDTALITRAGDRPALRIAPVRPNGPAAPWGLPG
ncbi:glycosyl hydrolase family 95 catalytic domain-containing protein [Streptomyces yaizuensis]|uniref:Tat pathway signal sequence domain protein n=1 Tax=Streptomyces yaizuensis TaxID=2989713 RepID=A0ABQ5P5N1_9ACTN|nr:Tat pathway signal sequence domain protein [Streptomyces sp. YSPA8]GLF97887.1 Tat pathway signal sequence domain protein [Streptomyces sp. YSPA8]